jgi:hypothetical protein
MMRRFALVLTLGLAACGGPSDPGEETTAQPAASPPPPAAADTPNYTPPVLVPEAAKGKTGATNVLLSWAQAMEDRTFVPAHALYGRNAPETAAEFAAHFADYKTITVAFGESEVEGAAGSLYYAVPITLTGTTQAGAPYKRQGTITLRRVNDVPGAEPWQLEWHVERIEWQGAQ